MKKKNLILSIVCVFLIVGSYWIGSIRGGEFGGADDQIQETVKEVNGDYKPWFNHVWEPPSGEIESLLFALQASIGAVFIGYYIGKKKNAKTNNGAVKNQ